MGSARRCRRARSRLRRGARELRTVASKLCHAAVNKALFTRRTPAFALRKRAPMRWVFGALAAALLLQASIAAAQPAPLAPTVTAAPPPALYVPTLRYKTHSPALMAGGIALTVLGGLSILSGATVIIYDYSHKYDPDGWGRLLSILVGAPLLIHGAGCFAGGIPMIVIGNRRIPVGYAGPPAVPSISVGPTTTLRWTF
jgi:hypothetical protein